MLHAPAAIRILSRKKQLRHPGFDAQRMPASFLTIRRLTQPLPCGVRRAPSEQPRSQRRRRNHLRDSVNTDAPVFLNYLLARFLSAGGVIVRGAVVHIDQVLAGGAHAFTAVKRRPLWCPMRSSFASDSARVSSAAWKTRACTPYAARRYASRAPWVQKCMSLSGRAVEDLDIHNSPPQR